MKQINLEKILLRNAKDIDKVFPEYVEDCKLAMIEFGKQLLELAAENAICKESQYGDEYNCLVDKQSILDTIKQVE